jgi:hypothetical protein
MIKPKNKEQEWNTQLLLMRMAELLRKHDVYTKSTEMSDSVPKMEYYRGKYEGIEEAISMITNHPYHYWKGKLIECDK